MATGGSHRRGICVFFPRSRTLTLKTHPDLSKFLQCTMDGSKDGVREHKTQLRQADVTSAGGADRHLEAFSVGRDWENVENQDWSNLCHSLSIFVNLC